MYNILTKNYEKWNSIIQWWDFNIEVQVSPDQETVWLTQKQMGELFGVKQATLSEHINNILESGELDETSIGFSDKITGGRKPKLYNLDMITSVGYKVNSKEVWYLENGPILFWRIIFIGRYYNSKNT